MLSQFDPTMMKCVSARPGESASQWYERAIVENSMAAATEESFAEAGNPTARRVAAKRSVEAAADLARALTALETERRRTDR